MAQMDADIPSYSVPLPVCGISFDFLCQPQRTHRSQRRIGGNPCNLWNNFFTSFVIIVNFVVEFSYFETKLGIVRVGRLHPLIAFASLKP